MNNKKIYFAISTAIFLCLISMGLLVSNNGQRQLSEKFPISSEKEAVSSTAPQFINPAPASPAEKSAEEKISIEFKAGDEIYQISISKGSSVYDVMTDLSVSSIKPFVFEAENYPSLGYFVKSINGIKNSGGYYWTLYVNSKYSNIGASQYKLKEGDRVEWKYQNNPQ